MKKIIQKNPIIFILSILTVIQSFFLLRAYLPKQTRNNTVSPQKTISSENLPSENNFSVAVNGKKYDCEVINGEDKNNIRTLSNLVFNLKETEDKSVLEYVEKINNCGTEKEYESSPELQKIWEKYPDIKADYEEYKKTKTYTVNDIQECKNFWGEAMNKSDIESSSEIRKWESEIEKLLSKNNCVTVQQSTTQSNTGYIRVSPVSIRTGEKVSLTYGYKDASNNEHLQSAITTVTVEVPSKKKYTAINGKVFPDDFPGSSTTETGIYRVGVKRTIETTSGSIDTLYSASSLFFVSEN